MPRVAVIGGGIGGAASALYLARGGHDVVLLERGDRLGGLVAGFEISGTPLERFYHYLVPREPEILELLSQLGLTDRIEWFPSSVGVLLDGKIWPFTSPTDLMRFRPLPFLDRVQCGLGAVRLGRINDWEILDGIPATDWLADLTSSRCVDVIWEPLLRAKFGPAAPNVPASFMWARMKQRAGGRRRGREYLGYLRGGFKFMFDALADALEDLGVEIRTGTAAGKLIEEGERVLGVETEREAIEADAVLYTGPLPYLAPLVPEQLRDPRWSAIGGLGAMCVIVEMTRPITDAFWVNVCDPTLPFGGIIEHTKLVPPEQYNGRHVAYLSRYFLANERIAQVDPAEEAGRWLEKLEEAVPGFSRASVVSHHAFRTPYAAPLVTVRYRGGIPPLVSHLPGLFVSTTAQIYPQDRGMSEGVRTARLAADAILASKDMVRKTA